MLMYWLSNKLFNPILKAVLHSPLRSLLPDNWVILTYTGRKTHKKRSLVFHVAQYKDEFIVVPGCFGELPNWWRNFRKESKATLQYKGKSMECLARTIEHDETAAVPRLAAYVRVSHADQLGITAETTKEKFNELVTEAAKKYPIVTIRPQTSDVRELALEGNATRKKDGTQESPMQRKSIQRGKLSGVGALGLQLFDFLFDCLKLFP